MQVGDLITYNVGSGRKSLGLILDRGDRHKPWESLNNGPVYDCVQIMWHHINKLPAMLDMSMRLSKRATVGDVRWYRTKTPSGFDAFYVLSSL